MYRIELNSLTVEDKDRVKGEIVRIYSRYNIETTVNIVENRRLKTTAGRFHPHGMTIEMNPKYYREFGIDRFIGTIRHEMAHFIQYIARGYTGHNREFKRICADLGGTMNQKMAADTCPDNGTTAYLKSDDKWHYRCPCGQIEFKTKRRIKLNNRICRFCRTSVRDFHIKQLR